MANLEIDLLNQKYKITNERKEIIDMYNANIRFETYGYTNENKKMICILIKIMHKKYGNTGAYIIYAYEDFNKYKMDYIKTLEEIDYSAIGEYKPPLIYNYDLAVEGIKENKNIFIVEDEKFANYLANKDFIAITILKGLKRDDINKDTLKVLNNANVYYIGKSLPFNVQKILKKITNKFEILSKEKDFINEFGENHNLLKVVQAYEDYKSMTKDTMVLVDRASKNSNEKIIFEM